LNSRSSASEELMPSLRDAWVACAVLALSEHKGLSLRHNIRFKDMLECLRMQGFIYDLNGTIAPMVHYGKCGVWDGRVSDPLASVARQRDIGLRIVRNVIVAAATGSF
jgi:hypothetical protein